MAVYKGINTNELSSWASTDVNVNKVVVAYLKTLPCIVAMFDSQFKCSPSIEETIECLLKPLQTLGVHFALPGFLQDGPNDRVIRINENKVLIHHNLILNIHAFAPFVTLIGTLV